MLPRPTAAVAEWAAPPGLRARADNPAQPGPARSPASPVAWQPRHEPTPRGVTAATVATAGVQHPRELPVATAVWEAQQDPTEMVAMAVRAVRAESVSVGPREPTGRLPECQAALGIQAPAEAMAVQVETVAQRVRASVATAVQVETVASQATAEQAATEPPACLRPATAAPVVPEGQPAMRPAPVAWAAQQVLAPAAMARQAPMAPQARSAMGEPAEPAEPGGPPTTRPLPVAMAGSVAPVAVPPRASPVRAAPVEQVAAASSARQV